MAKNEPTMVRELWVDGKMMHKWTGRRIPAGMERIVMVPQKGVEIKTYYIDEQGVRMGKRGGGDV